MKKNLAVILLLCLAINVAHAQNDAKSKALINDVVNKTDIVYQDSVGSWVTSFMRKGLSYFKTGVSYHFREDSLFRANSVGVKQKISAADAAKYEGKFNAFGITMIVDDSLQLTEKEKTYIVKQIDNMGHYKWDKDLLTNSKMIGADTITKLIKNVAAHGHFYTIGKPIFLRDDTYCFFYYGYNCTGDVKFCGEGKFAIDKKTKGKWRLWYLIRSWIS